MSLDEVGGLSTFPGGGGLALPGHKRAEACVPRDLPRATLTV